MKPSRTHRTQQEVLDAHVLQHSLNSTEVFLTPTSIQSVRNGGNPPNIPGGSSISQNPFAAGQAPRTPWASGL